jgi:choline dehydrogenase
MTETYDFIIAGAGSAGCVLADRLSADGRFSVLVLEAGASDRRFWIQVPIGYGRLYYDHRVNWKYQTEIDPGLGGRSDYWPRGKVLGGSASINAMVYIRGQREDYDDWRAAGNPGWGYDDILPYFKKSEDNRRGADAYHAAGGPLGVSSFTPHPLTKTFFDAARELGLSANDDFNGESQDGYGPYQITTRGGQRCSTARAFLRPALGRDNLRLELGAHVTRVLFDGTRATGVAYEQNGERKTARTAREVIVAGGAINAPQLLQLSGVGPADLSKRHGIDVVADVPGVGRNLQDHLFFPFVFKTHKPSLNNQLHSPFGKFWAGLKYILARRGPLSLSINHGGAFIRTRPDLTRPNMQLYFVPASFTGTAPDDRALLNPDPFGGVGINVSPCRPTSRGHIEIQSADWRAHPAIHPNYLSTDFDVSEALEGVRYVRRLADTAALSGLIEHELVPWPESGSDDVLTDALRQRARTTYHPIGTCAMGPDPASAVVDHRLRVHGLGGLRVIDASIMPRMVSGNTNAPTIMIAERGADFILDDHQG